MLLEEMQERSYSAVFVTLCRYVSNSIFKMMKDLGYLEYCKEGASKVLKDYLRKQDILNRMRTLWTNLYRFNTLCDEEIYIEGWDFNSRKKNGTAFSAFLYSQLHG